MIQALSIIPASSRARRGNSEIYDVFVDGVRALADASHAVERGNADAGGEISVGAAADGGFFELPANLLRDRLRFFVEAATPAVRSMGRRLMPPFDCDLAVLVEGLEGAQFSIERGGLLGML